MAGRPVLVPYTDGRGFIRGIAISLAAAVFLSISGAFTSGQVSFLARFGYWLVMLLMGYGLGVAIAHLVLSHPKTPKPLWARVVIVAVALAIPYTFVVGAASSLVFGAHFDLRDAPGLLGSVLIVSLAMTAINVMAESRRLAEAAPAPPKFLERLPLKLRGAEVWAVEAEDHYLRLHTSKGQDLILMRLADAIAELEGIEGAQVHRSWWIARDAVVEARRGDGRATLTLKDGAQVPVSRTYAGPLRERGWI